MGGLEFLQAKNDDTLVMWSIFVDNTRSATIFGSLARRDGRRMKHMAYAILRSTWYVVVTFRSFLGSFCVACLITLAITSFCPRCESLPRWSFAY